MYPKPEEKRKEVLFRELYDNNYSLVRYYIGSYINNREQAEDIAQEVFVSLWNNIHKLEKGSERGYILTIARNKCLNMLRRKKLTAEYAKYSEIKIKEDYLNLVALESTFNFIVTKELEDLVVSALNRMPPKISSTFKLSKFKSLKQEEIAVQENISVRAVEYRLKKAILILKKELRDFMVIIVAIALYLNYFK